MAPCQGRVVEIECQLQGIALGRTERNKSLAADRAVTRPGGELGHFQPVIGECTPDPHIGQSRAIAVIFIDQIVGADDTRQNRRLDPARKIGCHPDRTPQILIRKRGKREQGTGGTIVAETTRQRCREQSPCPGSGSRWKRPQIDMHPSDCSAPAPEYHPGIAAIGQKPPDEMHVDRLRNRCDAGPGEIVNLQPGVRFREGAGGALLKIKAAGRDAAQPQARHHRIDKGEIDVLQSALDIQTAAVIAGKLYAALGQINGCGQQCIFVAFGYDPCRPTGLERHPIGTAIKRNPPELRIENGIGGKAERHLVAALGHDLRGALSAPIINLRPRSGNLQFPHLQALDLDIGNNLRLVVQSDVRINDRPFERKARRSRQSRIASRCSDNCPLLPAERAQSHLSIHPGTARRQLPCKRSGSRLPDASGQSHPGELGPRFHLDSQGSAVGENIDIRVKGPVIAVPIRNYRIARDIASYRRGDIAGPNSHTGPRRRDSGNRPRHGSPDPDTQRAILVGHALGRKIDPAGGRIASAALSQAERGCGNIQSIYPRDAIAAIGYVCHDQAVAAEEFAHAIVEDPA